MVASEWALFGLTLDYHHITRPLKMSNSYPGGVIYFVLEAEDPEA